MSAGHKRIDLMISSAAQRLAEAVTLAEVVEAMETANIAFHTARAVARFARRKGRAQDIAAAHRAVGDALEIELKAKGRLASMYDAAKAAGTHR